MTILRIDTTGLGMIGCTLFNDILITSFKEDSYEKEIIG